MKRIIYTIVATVVGILLIGSYSVAQSNTAMLTGDSKTACEVILCLAASAGHPAECSSPLAKYFALQATPHKSLGEVRSSFLAKCPDGSSNDKNYSSLKSTLKSQNFECTAEEFNLDKHKDSYSIEGVVYRTMAEIPDFCKKLADEQYSDLKLPKYTCDKKWYSPSDWTNGYESKEVSAIEYHGWLANGGEGRIESYGGDTTVYRYLTLHPIKKDCWVNTGSKSGSTAYNTDYSDIKSNSDYEAATKEVKQLEAQERAKYKESLSDLKNSSEYKNYANSLEKLKQSEQYRNYER